MKYGFLLPGSAGPKVEPFTSVCSGFWLSPARVKQNWRITVGKKDDPKVAGAYDAKDAYAVDLARADSGNAAPGLRVFWSAALSLIGQRPQRVFSLFASRIQPK
jgi:hypothetical protein